MRYLFFDIECCDGEHICEFGYVITDENFKEIETQVFKINPNKPFNLTDRKGRPRIKLYFTEKEYEQSPKFPEFYEKIKELLEYKEQIIMGHSLENDVLFLKTACEQYGLVPIDFGYIDSQKIYSEFANIHRQISLEEAKNILNLEQPKFSHRSDEDAKLTMRLVEKMCLKLGLAPNEVQVLCPQVGGKSHDINKMYTGNDLAGMIEALSKDESTLANGKKSKCIREFAKIIRASGEIVKSELNGSFMCFSSSYEKEHTLDLLKLIQRLADYGCRYSSKVLESDYYVLYDGDIESAEETKSGRYYSALHGEKKDSIKILTFDELYQLIGISNDGLVSTPLPKINVNKIRDAKPRQYYSTGSGSATLADLLRSKGYELDKKINVN